MITKIMAVGLKGLDFAYDLSKHNLITGPNGVGKSAITDALVLTVEGKAPGAGKTNQAIMDAFATGNKMHVGVVSNDIPFERRFVRNNAGKVTQKFIVSNHPVSKEQFITKFAEAGKPTIVNLSEFLALSDEKKIDAIFALYPPQGDLVGLQDEIEKAQGKLNERVSSIKNTENIIEKLSADKAEIELPAGTLAEVQEEIESTLAEVNLARGNLKRQIKRDAEKEATENAERRAKAEREKEAEQEREANKEISGEEKRPSLIGQPDHTARNSEDYGEPFVYPDDPGTVPPSPETGEIISSEPYGTKEYAKQMVEGSEGEATTITHGAPGHPNPKESINAIMDIMKLAGCTSCAAMLKCKKELLKY